MRYSAAILLLLSSPALAQGFAANDSRVQTLAYEEGGVLTLQTSAETSQTVLFAQGERIQSIIVSDPGAYFITVSGSGDSLTLRANGPSSLAMMSVRTEARSYDFELVSGRTRTIPIVLRVSQVAERQEESTPAPIYSPSVALPKYDYRVSGDQALQPSSISDDGERTYIEWQSDRPMPATFAVGSGGQEQIVDGYVRDGIFTIDRVYSRLIFRIDKQSALARRETGRGSDGRN